MKSIHVEGLTIWSPSKKTMIACIRDLTKRVLAGEAALDPRWSVNKSLRVLGKMLRIAREM